MRSRSADRAGLDVFGIGEHHRAEFLDSALRDHPSRGSSAHQQYLGLTSAEQCQAPPTPCACSANSRPSISSRKAARNSSLVEASFGEAYPLFGMDPQDYDELFAEKLALFLKLGETKHPIWKGRFRSALEGQGVYPRPHQARLPIWIGVGGTPASFARAGTLGLPLMVAIIGGTFERFRPLVDLYRDAGSRAGHSPDKLKVGVHAMGFVGETTAAAKDAFFPGWAHLTARIGRERGWSPPSRQQFDAMAGPKARSSSAIPQRSQRRCAMPMRPRRRLAHHLPDEHGFPRNRRDEAF